MDNNEQTKLLRSIRNWLAYLSLLITGMIIWPIIKPILGEIVGATSVSSETSGKILLLFLIIGILIFVAHVFDKSKEGQ